MAEMRGAVKWIYQARRVATQANAGGGAVKVDISLATGQVAKIVSVTMTNSGTNDANIWILDEDNAIRAPLCSIASAATTQASAPRTYTAITTGTLVTSTDMLMAPGEKLSAFQTGAGAQNDTLTVAIELELYNLATEPTWSIARSTNFADVTLAPSTISAANTLQPVIY